MAQGKEVTSASTDDYHITRRLHKCTRTMYALDNYTVDRLVEQDHFGA